MEAVVISFVGTVRLQAVNGDDLIMRPSPDRVRFDLKDEGVNFPYDCPRPGPIDVGLLAVAGAKCGGEEPNPVSRFVLVPKPPVAQAGPGNSLANIPSGPVSGVKDTISHGLGILLPPFQGLVGIAKEKVKGSVAVPTYRK